MFLNVKGEATGAPGRTDWYGFISIGGAIAWPWFSHGTRAVLVAQLPGGFGPWLVFEPEGTSDTQLIGAAAEADGTVHMVYLHSRPGMSTQPGGKDSASYLTVSADRLSGTDSRERNPPEAAASDRMRVVSAQGGYWPVDAQWLVRHLLWSEPVAWPHKEACAFAAGPAGGDAFHATFVGRLFDPWPGRGGRPVRYLLLADGRWSAPIDLGATEVSSIRGSTGNPVEIASAGDIAYVAWPTPSGIVARRVVRERPW